jgi:hypothetical protein
LQTHHPTTTIALYEPPHYLPPSLLAAISNGVPETEPQQLGFGLSAKILSSVHFFLSSPISITFSYSILAL